MKIKAKPRALYSKVAKYLKKVIPNIIFTQITQTKVKLLISKIVAGSQQKRKAANSLKRSVNGNISTNNFKVFTWNKGNTNIVDKMVAIEDIIKREKPSVLFVQELNLNIFQLRNVAHIRGYRFESDNLLEENKIVRLGCWISRDLVYERLREVEDKHNPLIGLSIGYPKKKRLKLIGYYRQFQSLNKNEKKDNKRELSEFTNICKKISKLIDNKDEVMMAADFNIDL